MNQREAFDRLRRVRDELEAGRFALSRVAGDWDEDPDVRIAGSRLGVTEPEIRRCLRNLQATFALRLFVAFEGVVRDYWSNGIGRETEPPMSDLMNAVARRRGMNDDHLKRAHAVREYRNAIVHEDLGADPLDFPQCRSALGRYLGWLPLAW